MKKFLLLALWLLAAASTVEAAALNIERSGLTAKVNDIAASRAAAQPDWTLGFITGEDITADYLTTTKTTFRVAIRVPAYIAQQLKGSKLTDFKFYMGISTSTLNTGRAFVSKGFTDEMIFDKEITLNLGTLSGQSFTPGVNTVELDTPYEFTGEEVLIGYEFTHPRVTETSKYYPLCFGYEQLVSSCGDYVAIKDKNGNWQWGHIRFPLAIYANISGTALPAWPALIGASVNPVNKPNESVSYTLELTNIGASPVTSVKGVTYVGDTKGDDQTINLTTPLKTGRKASVRLTTTPISRQGIHEVVALITGFNDLDADTIGAGELVKVVENGYKHNIVAEEWTGTWCGYCPRGIWGMETMAETHPDDFIGVAIHASNGQNAVDPMNYSAYISALYNEGKGYANGFPGALVDHKLMIDPNPTSFENAVKQMGGNSSFGQVELSAKWLDDTKTKIVVNTTARINYSAEDVNITPSLAASKYLLCYIITENGIEATQANYFAGGGSGACGGWERKSSKVKWTFTDVARHIEGYGGIKGSLPEVMEKGVDYTHEQIIDLPKNIVNPGNCDITVVMINTTDGQYENAARIKRPLYNPAGIDTPADARQVATVRWFTPSGIETAQPSAGNIAIKVTTFTDGTSTAEKTIAE